MTNRDLNIRAIYLSVSAITNNQNEWNQEIKIENSKIIIILDTGSQANVLPYRIFKELETKDTSLNLKIY